MSPTTADTLRGIRQILVVVQDLDRAVAFYRDVLGLRFLFTAPPGMAFFDCGGVRLLLGSAEGSQARLGTSVLYYAVEDIHAAAARLEGKGVSFVAAPHLAHRAEGTELWLAEFTDSEGNTAALMSEVAAA